MSRVLLPFVLAVVCGCASPESRSFDSAAERTHAEGGISSANEAPAASAPAPAFLAMLQEPPPEPGERLVIYTGNFEVQVANLPDALSRFLKRVEEMGGYLQTRQNARAVVRVPAERFHDAVDVLPTLGKVLSDSIQALDATREFRDLGIRLGTAEKALARLVALLEKAEKVEEILLIEKEIHRLTEEVERLKGTLRHLADRIAYSTIDVSFRSPASQPRPFPRRTRSPFPWINRVGMTHVLDSF